MKAKISDSEDIATWTNEGGATADTQDNIDTSSEIRNEDPDKLPTPVIVFLRVIAPIAIAAVAMILVLSTKGTLRYFFAIFSLIGVSWYVFQFISMHKRRDLTPEIKP